MRNLFFALLIFVLPISACAQEQDVASRDALIAQYIEWRGGDAFTELTSIVQEGTMEASGLSGTATVVSMRDGRMLFNADLEVIEFLQVLHPDGSWAANTSGQIEDLGLITETNAQRGLEMTFDLPLLAGGNDVSRLEAEEKDGQSWAILRVSYDDGNYFDMFLNEVTGAHTWSRVGQDTETYWVRAGEWSVVDGIRVAGRTEELREVAADNVQFHWQEYTFNQPIPDMVFARPSDTRKTAIAGGAPSTGWIDFDYYRDSRIFIRTVINSIETEAVLDSGAEVTVIDAALAEQAGLLGEGALSASGTGGNTEVQIATGVNLTIGNLQLNDLTVAILDMGNLADRLLGRPLPIILGKEVFNEMVVDVDYPNRRIAFHEVDQWSYQGVGTREALSLHEGLRVMEITVEGGAPIQVGFDIGQGSALTLFEGYVNESGLLDGRPVTNHLGGGVGGAVISPHTSIGSMTFGGTTFSNVPVGLAIGAEGSFNTETEQGNLGTGIFNRFRMIVNYSNDEVILEIDPSRANTPFDKERAGIQVQVTEGVAQVIFVMEGSPAEDIGMAVGDKITAIGGVPVSDDYWFADQWRWSRAAPGAQIAVTLDDGREFELTLADFY